MKYALILSNLKCALDLLSRLMSSMKIAILKEADFE